VARFVTPAVEVASVLLVVAGVALVFAPAALIVLGAFGLAFARAQA
jgi:hypothetical protein